MVANPDGFELVPLDLFSTSQNEMCFAPFPAPKCTYRAPYFAYAKTAKTYGVTQGCCNHWDCPRCGIMRARHEYGRIVTGVRELAKEGKIWFLTITCRGAELDYNDAIKGYLTWTNRLFSTLRANAKKRGEKWCYVQVTEHQKRAHPHSHILTTYAPPDVYLGHVYKWYTDNRGDKHERRDLALRCDYLREKCVSAGLGEQYDISIVNTAEGASRYVAKYLFKDGMFSAQWPDKWKRVRYSQNFPKLPEVETDAFVLLSGEDWRKLASLAVVVVPACESAEDEARTWLRGHDVIVERFKSDRTGEI